MRRAKVNAAAGMRLKMMMHFGSKLFWATLPLVIGIITPSAILVAVEVGIGGIAFGKAVADVSAREFAEGENIFLLSLIGLIPFAFLSLFSFAVAGRMRPQRLACVSLGGLLGILACVIPTHVMIWRPVYGGGHVSSTSAIAFLFIPFYAVVTLVVGMLAGWVVSKLLPARAR